MEYGLERVHQANLRILKEIDRICRKHGLLYFLDAGTLLGAVRHGGFIPWDDDADVAFTRPNYESFIRAARRELPPDMELVFPWSYGDGGAFYDFTARIIFKNSRTRPDDAEAAFYGGKLSHLWVDLFTVDVLPESAAGALLAKTLQKAVYLLAMGHRYQLYYAKYTPFHRLAVRTVSVFGRYIPLRHLLFWQRTLAMKDRNKKSGLCYYSNYQPDFLYVTLKREWCENTVPFEFEDTELMGPQGWDEILTLLYGDYLKLPPKEERRPAHATMAIEVYDAAD